MNELTVFNRDIIPVYTTDTGEKIVVGRELHSSLKIGTEYAKCFDRMCEYGFSDGKDYSSILANRSDGLPDKPKIDHHIKLDMAKHIAMIQRTPEGMAIRQKLIELETDLSALSPQLRLLINIEIEQKRQASLIDQQGKRLDSIREIVALNPHDWRKESAAIIAKAADCAGGMEYIQPICHEIYELIEKRYGVSLKTRLTNKRRRMADEGICKSVRDKINRLDIIAEDKKLVEGYIAIVKKIAIRHGVDLRTVS